MMYARTIVLAMAALALASPGCQPPGREAAGLSDEDAAAIRAFNEAHMQNALAGDWAADAALYTEDGARLPPNGAVIRGRAAIEASLAQIDTVLNFRVNDVEIDGRGDLAYVWKTFSITLVPRGSTEPVADTGKSLLIFRKRPDGSWLLARVIWNSDLPPAE